MKKKKKNEDQKRKVLAIEQDKKWACVELLSKESQETARKAAELERERKLQKRLQIEEIAKTKALSVMNKESILEKQLREQQEKEQLENDRLQAGRKGNARKFN